jgi:mRNA-degrading endonuclease RelE of RelBE toxin-antitoxin system
LPLNHFLYLHRDPLALPGVQIQRPTVSGKSPIVATPSIDEGCSQIPLLVQAGKTWRKKVALNIEWSEEARTDIRRFDKPTARRIFDALLRFVRTGQGDVKQLRGQHAGESRLPIRDYRLLFSQAGAALRVHGVRHRSVAYR